MREVFSEKVPGWERQEQEQGCSCNREDGSALPVFNDEGMIEIRYCKFHPDAKAPQCMTAGSAGFDLTAVSREYDEESGCYIYGTGIGIELPRGYVGRILCRSSVYKKDLSIIEGTVDSDYRGELRVMFRKTEAQRPYARIYEIGERVAQLVIYQCERVSRWRIEPSLSPTARGAGGFGSTGV